ncbi:MAG: copper amine oxidase N-terminal domain-containing protein, partial [Peptococcaceae bacterium]|nr:copper amine oxidase N-terminal domain-containing protein [Peptococcaceae bacterium]
YGEIEVSISGDVADDHDVVVANYADFGVDVSIESVKDIKAGKFNQELKTITIEENVPGTLVKNRDITLIFPDWVKITNAKVRSGGSYATLDTFDGTDNEIDLTIIKSTSGTTTKAKIKLDLEISVEGNRSGDIEMTVEGKRAGMAEDVDLVVGNAVALVTAEADANKDVKIGVQAQEIGDITISELVKEAISDKPNGKIDGNVVLTLPEGVSFSAKPKVEVTEGNLDIKSDNVGLSKDDSVLTIPIKSDSSKASTITVSNVKLTVDRTVPTGDLILKVGGGAIIENQKANKEGWLDGRGVSGSSDTVDEGEFDTGTAVKVKIANIVTPAPGEVSGTSVFTIGSTTYTVNGVEKSMDVAPYIKGDRTYIPVRFVAQAAGVADNNIIWNEADQSVILIKGDRVVKMVIGSNQLMINGIAVSMDTVPEIVDPGRTMLPLRAVTQALGCVVDWDPETQAASVTL